MTRLYPSQFVLVGSMNPEEGSLRPQILDRFGLRVWVAPLDDEVDGSVDFVADLAFSGDAETLVAVSSDSRLRVLDPEDGRIVRTIEVGPTTAVDVSTDGRFAATAGQDQRVRIWDLDRGREARLQELDDVEGTVADVTFSGDEDSSRVAAVGARAGEQQRSPSFW